MRLHGDEGAARKAYVDAEAAARRIQESAGMAGEVWADDGDDCGVTPRVVLTPDAARRVAELLDVDQRCQILLTSEQAQDLWDWMEGGSCPDWWETPLTPIHDRIKDYVRFEQPW